MKKWFFSDNGKIIGPLGLKESKELIANTQGLFAWHPSYTQWMPVGYIEEFEVVFSVPTPPSDIPKELIEEFIGDERELIAKLDSIGDTLSSTDASLPSLNKNIEHYTQLTKNLNEEVKAVISNIEQQYAALQKSLSSATKGGLSS